MYATKAERKLWQALRGKKLGVKFRRQHPLYPLIVDFCCIKANLIIEVDGPYHLTIIDLDKKREIWLKNAGWTVLRFTNH